MAITTVFFDIYGTLAGFDPPREVVQQRAAGEFGLELSLDGINAGYRDADHLMAEQNSVRPVRSMSGAEQREFFARYEQLVLAGSGHSVDLETAAKVWARVRAQDYGWALFADVLPGLESLRGAGYRVAALSNMPYTGSEVMKMLGLDGAVEFVVTSGDVGVEKPDPRIFRAALERVGVDAAEAVMVGDSVGSDLRAAEAVGMRAVLMDRYNNHPWHSEHPRVTSAGQVLDALAQLSSGA